jgi:anti-sigma regulatory factor (Ser/Thr protein kinase)
VRKEQLIRAKTEQLDSLLDSVNVDLEAAGCPAATVVSVGICLEEIFVNVAHYGYPEGNGDVRIIEEIENDEITLEIEDWGVQYNPLLREDPDITLSAEERQIGGLGIYMVRNMMDGVSYEYRDGMNCLKMWKKW